MNVIKITELKIFNLLCMRTRKQIETDLLSTNLRLEQLKKELVELVEVENKERQNRYSSCGEHEYEYTNSKWRSVNEMRCIHCGHTKD